MARRAPWTASIVAFAFAACATRAPDSPRISWVCPADWVPYARGGCGPAVLLCGADGGASDGACISASTDASAFALQSDGAIRGGWHEPGEPGGPPAPDWFPLADVDCPAGWLRAADGSCDPALRDDCEPGSGPLPGGQCTQTGDSSCTAGAFPDVSAEAGGDRVVYVLASAPASGADGSVAHPFATIEQGVVAAGTGGWVLVGAGSYTPALNLRASVHIVGVCAARTRLANAATVVSAGGSATDVDLRSIGLFNSSGAVLADAGATVRLTHVSIARSLGAGVVATGNGTHVLLDDVFLDGTRFTADHHFGEAVHTDSAAILDAQRVSIRAAPSGFAHGSRAAMHVTDSAILDGVTAPDDANVCGIEVLGGSGTIERCAVRNVAGDGICSEAGSITGRDVWVGGNHQSHDLGGRGVTASGGAHITLERALLDGNAEAAMLAYDPDTTLDATRVVARNGQIGEPTHLGAAVIASEGAHVTVQLARFESNHGNVFATGGDTTLALADTLVLDTQPDDRSVFSYAIAAQRGASIETDRVYVDGYLEYGALAADHARLALRDSVVTHGRGATPNALGVGVIAWIDSEASLSRTLVRDVRSMGVLASTGGSMLVEDSAIDTVGSQFDGAHGSCGGAQEGAALTLRRVLATNCRQEGIRIGSNAQATLEDVIVRHVEPSLWGFGLGLEVAWNARADATRVSIEGVHAAGVVTSQPPPNVTDPVTAHFAATDLFVRGVAPGTVEVVGVGGVPIATGDPIAYGLQTVRGASIDTSHVVVDDTEYGFFDADGVIALHEGVIARASVTAGAIASPAASYTLDRVGFAENRSNDIPTIRTLPPAASLPEPSAACAMDGCL